MMYAINYVLGYDTHTAIVDAPDADDAYDLIRDELRRRRLYSASLQGACRLATQSDIDNAGDWT